MKINKVNKSRSIILSVLVAVLVGFFVQQFFFSGSGIDKALMLSASELNKTCPVYVDNETRLDNAVALPENTLQFNFTMVNRTKDSVDTQKLKEILAVQLLNSIKTNPALKIHRDNNVTFNYSYNDKDGQFVMLISINAAMYKD